MKLNCFQAITWTAGIKTASRRKQRTYKSFIKLYKIYEYDSHRFFSLSQCLSNDFLNKSGDAFAASLLAKTTISILINWCCFNLKFSRTVLLIKFLVTAFLIFFLAIASPSLGCECSFIIASKVKNLSVDFTGFANTFLYSSGFPNLNWEGKLK